MSKKSPAGSAPKASTTPKAGAKAPQAPKEPQKIVREVTQEDLDANPDLVEAGVAIGDQIEFNVPAEKAPKEAKVENKPESTKAKASAGKMFGNKNSEIEFDERWKDAVVVRQSDVKKVGDGNEDYVEVPSSVRIMPYEPAVYERLEKDKSFGSSKVKILHDPR